MTGPPTADATARHAITNDLDATLFVEAGAGSGKTRALVDRVLALVASGVTMRSIVAITFTERAAAELRHRLRARIAEQFAATPDPHWSAALDDLDGSAVGTLHAFAQRLLTEHPIEAGLPPDVEVLDEITSQIEFDHRWNDALDRFHSDAELAPTLHLAHALKITADHLRTVALEFARNWDLVAAHPPGRREDPPPIDTAPIIAALTDLAGVRSHCLEDDDGMASKLEQIGELAERLAAAPDDASFIEILQPRKPLSFKSRVGSKARWPDGMLDEIRGAMDRVPSLIEEALAPVTEACLQRLAHHLGEFVIAESDRRRIEGRLQFHDLLVHARRLLADRERGPGVRTALSERYRRLLLDEFQDTDPLQIELATLLAADPGDPAAPWDRMDTRPGRLFFVGDPKQSIYRFRRADIDLYLHAQDRHRAPGREPVELSRNFRSAAPILDWVNHTFGQLIEFSPGRQPAYRPLEAVRPPPPVGPGVALLDGTHDSLAAAQLRTEEAASVAATIRRAIDEGWSVRDDDAEDGWRPAGFGDVCVLVPARTSLPQLEAALTETRIPYRVETSTLLYAAEDVRSLMACLRAIADPSDTLALATALRSPAYGCGDDDLYEWAVTHRGRWDHRAERPDGIAPDHPVAEAMASLADLAVAARWLTPPQVIDRLIHERRLLESAAFASHTTDRWRHLRFVADQARAWADTNGGDLRAYLAWARLQASDTARVAEPVLDEADVAAVRIMTIHASKGLEFPITVLSGLTTRGAARRPGPVVLFPPDRPAVVKLKADLAVREFERLQPIDEQMDLAERVRLLYVGCTRACDHLVVACHRIPASTDSAAEQLWRAGGGAGGIEIVPWSGRSDPGSTGEDLATPLRPPGTRRSARPEVGPDATRDAFEATRVAAIARAADPVSLSATSIARLLEPDDLAVAEHPGLLKDAVDLDLPPWRRGRDGAAIGRAVHAVLQDGDLRSGGDLRMWSDRHAEAEGIADLRDQIERMARSAVAAPSVREAVAGRYWREPHVAAPLGSRLVEGYIDLLYRTDTGFIIVDYKTDEVASDAERESKASVYRHQLATYAHAIESTTGLPTERSVLCFLDTDTAHEVIIDDLRAAVSELDGVAGRG